MKSMKKLASLLLALAMIFTLATTAFAEGTNTITVKDTVANETYTIYKMLNLVVDNQDNPTAFSYTVADGWSAFFTDGAGKDYVTISEAGYVTWKDGKDTEAEMIKFGQVAKAAATGGETQVASGDSVTFKNLENGYYLITSTLGTQAIVNSTPSNKETEIAEKNPEDTIEKKVQEDSTQEWGDKNDAQIGDTVNFKSTATLYPYTTNVKIHDTMDAGLTYNNDVKIYIDETFQSELTAGHYSIKDTPETGDTFTIEFKETYLASLTAETKLYLKYSAVLNENAVKTTTQDATTTTEIDDQINSTKITYGDKQSLEASTTTTTHKVTVNKYADNVENLAGAVFSLKKNDNVVNLLKLDDRNYRVAKANETDAVGTFTTVATGDIVIWGLDTDTDYTLEEITAPAGYNKLDKEVNVTVNADNSSKIDVENKTGTELPSTGGMGTTLFYVLGGVLVAAAVVLLVTKKRMAN